MKRWMPPTLRARITISFVLLTSLITVLFSAVVYVGFDAIERYIFNESLETEAEWLSASLQRGITPAVPTGRKFFDEMNAPERYAMLPLGYHELEISHTEEWHLLVFEVDGRRYFLLQDGSSFEELEGYIALLLLLALLFSLATAFWVGRKTSAHVIAPITRLATAVKAHQTPFPYQQADDEIGILARAFAAHTEELQQYLWREQCFVGDVSHELRTPLAIILGAAEVLERQTRAMPEQAGVYAGAMRIERVAREMNEQLTAMLLLSRAPEQLDAPATPIAPIVEACIERCRPLLEGKPVQLQFDDKFGGSIAGRPELIASVIHNLLRNACQYTDRGSIAVELTPQSLTLSDTGPGLPASVDPALLQQMRHSEAARGEGLGLSIAQRIVAHLGWRMTIRNGPQGSHFRIDFGRENRDLKQRT